MKVKIEEEVIDKKYRGIKSEKKLGGVTKCKTMRRIFNCYKRRQKQGRWSNGVSHD